MMTCPDGLYKDDTLKTCKPCSKTCKNCSEFGANKCTECYTGL